MELLSQRQCGRSIRLILELRVTVQRRSTLKSTSIWPARTGRCASVVALLVGGVLGPYTRPPPLGKCHTGRLTQTLRFTHGFDLSLECEIAGSGGGSRIIEGNLIAFFPIRRETKTRISRVQLGHSRSIIVAILVQTDEAGESRKNRVCGGRGSGVEPRIGGDKAVMVNFPSQINTLRSAIKNKVEVIAGDECIGNCKSEHNRVRAGKADISRADQL